MRRMPCPKIIPVYEQILMCVYAEKVRMGIIIGLIVYRIEHCVRYSPRQSFVGFSGRCLLYSRHLGEIKQPIFY